MVLVCCCRASGETKEAWDVWVEEEADWEGFLKVMNRSSQSIIIESLSRWKGEQQDDSHQEEEDSASATSENGKRGGKRPTATT